MKRLKNFLLENSRIDENKYATTFQFDREVDREDLTYELNDEFPDDETWEQWDGSDGYTISAYDKKVERFINSYIKKNKIKAKKI